MRFMMSKPCHVAGSECAASDAHFIFRSYLSSPVGQAVDLISLDATELIRHHAMTQNMEYDTEYLCLFACIQAAAAQELDELCFLSAQSMPSLKVSQHFQMVKLLGEGSYGKVMLAVHKKRGQCIFKVKAS